MNGKERTRSGTKPGKGNLLITVYDSYLYACNLCNFLDKKEVLKKSHSVWQAGAIDHCLIHVYLVN